MPRKRASVVPQLVRNALRVRRICELDFYEAALATGCASDPPPYGMAWYGDLYRSLALDPSWMANSLVSNAAKEGEGSEKLWVLAGRTADPEISEQVRRHAIDESQHARYYISMLRLAFPEAMDRDTFDRLLRLSPGYSRTQTPERSTLSADESVIDEIIQMNIGKSEP